MSERIGICDRLNLPSTDEQKASPKPRPRVLDRIEKKRIYEHKAGAFRSAVWKRDKSQCRLCGKKVTRSVDSTVRGHVHHIRRRNVAPEDKYNPAAALLVCAICHAKIHSGQAPKPAA